jgi:hypothetical protein
MEGEVIGQHLGQARRLSLASRAPSTGLGRFDFIAGFPPLAALWPKKVAEIRPALCYGRDKTKPEAARQT